MIKFLKLKRTKRVRKKTGKTITRALYIEKTYKMGKVVLEKNIATNQPVLVCGKHAAGKTRWLRRLYANANEIWSKQQSIPLYFDSNSGVSEWKDHESIRAWWDCNNEKKWEKLTGHKKERIIIDYVADIWTVVFVDNMDRLSGRKLDLVKRVLQSSKSKIWVASSTAENRIGPSLREMVLKPATQTFYLTSPAAYDGTNILVMTACVIFLIMGHIEIAVLLGFFKVLARGMFSAKQQ